MKVAAALKAIDAGWAVKKKGYRVYFESCADGACTPDTMPGPDEAPLPSDVVAWRSAWKLAQAGHPGNPEMKGADLVNITVVDDAGAPVPFYGTGRFKIYNRRDGAS